MFLLLKMTFTYMLCLLFTIFSFFCLIARLFPTTACPSPVKGSWTRNKWFPLPKQELCSASHLASLVIAIGSLVQWVCTNLFWLSLTLARNESMAQKLTNVLQALEEGECAIEGTGVNESSLLDKSRLRTGNQLSLTREILTKNQLSLTSFHLGAQYSDDTSPSQEEVDDEEEGGSEDLTCPTPLEEVENEDKKDDEPRMIAIVVDEEKAVEPQEVFPRLVGGTESRPPRTIICDEEEKPALVVKKQRRPFSSKPSKGRKNHAPKMRTLQRDKRSSQRPARKQTHSYQRQWRSEDGTHEKFCKELLSRGKQLFVNDVPSSAQENPTEFMDFAADVKNLRGVHKSSGLDASSYGGDVRERRFSFSHISF
jgi:hypothetical protein